MTDKEYLPELKVGKTLIIGPYKGWGGRFRVTVSTEMKNIYETVAKETGLSLDEILKEQNKLFDTLSDGDFSELMSDMSKFGKRLSERIIKNRLSD